MKQTGSRSWLAPIFILCGAALLASTLHPLIISWRIPVQRGDGSTESILSSYSFVEDDYPSYYPLGSPEVVLTVEDTVHYQVPSPEADSEWASMFPPGGGFMRLGPEGRPFVLTLYHQLHCLDRIRRAVDNSTHYSSHVHHCLNYIRQLVLCEASSTLEPVIQPAEPDSYPTYGPVERSCMDWSHVYEVAAANFASTASSKMRGRSERAVQYM